jgi:threonine dehydratase
MMDLVETVIEAERRIRPYIRETYVERSSVLGERSGAEVYLKLENLQHTGSFKARGAMNRVLAMSYDEQQRGVIAASTGNNGAAVARAAREVGIPCTVVVPEHADESKLAAIRRLGATIDLRGHDCVESERYARRHCADHGITYISPYNDPLVIAGQGTVALELARQLERIDAVFVSLGGGGLVSGIAGYLKGTGLDTHIVACSPENSAVMIESVRAGRILDLPSKPTLSDGTAGGVEEGAVTFELCRSLVDEYITVPEEEIAATLRRFLDTHHLLIEGAAAVALAAFERHAARFTGQRVAIVICGGNIGLETLRRIL